MTFRGQVAVVTGAASGMGRLAARRLAASGATVIAVDVDEPGLIETARRNDNTIGRVVDVTDADAVAVLAKEVEAEHGPIDRLMHAAAIAPTARLLEQPIEVVHRVMAVNYGGTVNVARAVVPAMVERDRGDVVVFASLAGWFTAPAFGAYTASKFAVVAFAETLAIELHRSALRICCVCPPIVDTPLLDQIDEAALHDQPKLAPEVVLDAVERALERGRLYTFPGPVTPTLVRARKFLPGLVRRRMAALGDQQ